MDVLCVSRATLTHAHAHAHMHTCTNGARADDFLQLFLQLATGVVKAIVRLAIAFGVLLIASLRVDRSLFPQWVDELMVLDQMAKSFRALVLIYHHHNNPTMHVFLNLLAQAASERKSETTGPETTTLRKLLVACRWRKYAFMALNPKVAALKAEYVEPEHQSVLSALIQPNKKESPKGKRVLVSDASEKKDDDAQLA